MKVLNYEDKNKDKSYCLAERFGSGIHLIKNKKNGTFILMIIRSCDLIALFIDNNNEIASISGEEYNGKYQLQYSDFDKCYMYIKKLNADELVIDLKK